MRLKDADELRRRMYHEAFETDSDMQKWDSGCWIRYKLFENVIDSVETIDAVEVVRCRDCRHKNNSRIVFGTYGQHLHHCNELNQIVSDDFYCANGERRTE